MNWEKIKLDRYEKEIEDNIERAQRVENFENWKELVEESAKGTLQNLEAKKKFRVTVEFSSTEMKEEAIKLLKEHFGEQFKVVREI